MSLCLGWVLLTLSVNFFADKLGTSFYLYFGNFIAWSFSAIGAAYAITKIVYASISTGNAGKWYNYKGNSEIGDYIGLWNLLTAGFYIVWAAGIAMMGFEQSNMIWTRWTKMQKAGTPLDEVEAYKYLAMSFIIGGGAMISGYAMGDNASELFGFFISYNTAAEGVNHASSPVTDDSGTSLFFDASYHVSIMMLTGVLYSWIGTMAFAFGWYWLGNELPSEIAEIFGKVAASAN